MSSSKPSTRKGEHTRDTILSNAAHLVHLQSVAATSLNDVMEASGTGKSQIYHYFQNKDDMIRQVIAFRAAEFETRLVPMLEQIESWEDVEAWFGLALEEQRAQGFIGGCPFGSMAAEVSDRDEILRLDLATFFRCWINQIAHGLHNLQSRNLLHPEANLEALATMVLTSLEGGMLLSKTLKDEMPLKRALEGAMMILKMHAV
jgi:TetR/AcrR family transcriptional regulator, transcriptional repressor for nem operon